MSDGEFRTVGDVLDAYIEDRKKNVGHPASLMAHLKPLREEFGDMPLSEALGRGGVLRNRCIRYCAENAHLAQNTLRKRMSVFQAAFTMAWKKEKISGRPLIHIPPAQAPKQRAFGPEQRAALLKAADSYPTEDHTRTFVYLAVYTGQLAGKILAMTWDQVRFNENCMYFYDRRGKQERVELHPKLKAVLERAYDARSCDYVVEWRGKRVTSVYHSMKRLLKRAGLRGMNAHDLRFAVEADEAEAQVSDDYIFLSYCRADGLDYANALCNEFERWGQRCWIDHRDMHVGSFAGQLTRAVKGARGVILLLTPLANDSPDVVSEVARAATAKVPVLPIKIEHTSLGEELDHFLHKAHSINWSSNSEKTAQLALEKLGIGKKL